jgi:thiol-disulfide isomerase/thioredoxin
MKSSLFPIAFLLSLYTNVGAAVLSGKILNHTAGSYVFFNYSDDLVFIKDSAAVDKSGNFQKSFSDSAPRYVYVSYKKHRAEIYIFPKGNISWSFDAQNAETFAASFSIHDEYRINQYVNKLSKDDVYRNYLSKNIGADEPFDSLANVLKRFRVFTDSVRTAYFKAYLPIRNKAAALKQFLFLDSLNSYSYSLLTAIDHLRIIKDSTGRSRFWQNEITDKMPLAFRRLNSVSTGYEKLWLYYINTAYENQKQTAASVNNAPETLPVFLEKYFGVTKSSKDFRDFLLMRMIVRIWDQSYFSKIGLVNENSDISMLRKMIADNSRGKRVDSFLATSLSLFNLRSKVRGMKADEINLIDTTGQKFSLKSFAGSVVLIDMWATWCRPCIEEFPELRNVERQFKGRNF